MADKMYGSYSDADLNDWERFPMNASVLTSSAFGAWLLRRDERRDKAIPKADYENRLKADLITMLVALQLQFASRHCKDMRDCWWLIEDKINALKAESEAEDDKS